MLTENVSSTGRSVGLKAYRSMAAVPSVAKFGMLSIVICTAGVSSTSVIKLNP